MENIISLDHNDIDQAIKDYIESQGINLVNKSFDIKFTQGRGANATNSANVHVSNAVVATPKEVDNSKAVSANKSADATGKQETIPTEKAATTSTDEVAVDTAEIDLSDEQPPITEETVTVEDEPEKDDSEPADTQSLFGK